MPLETIDLKLEIQGQNQITKVGEENVPLQMTCSKIDSISRFRVQELLIFFFFGYRVRLFLMPFS